MAPSIQRNIETNIRTIIKMEWTRLPIDRGASVQMVYLAQAVNRRLYASSGSYLSAHWRHTDEGWIWIDRYWRSIHPNCPDGIVRKI